MATEQVAFQIANELVADYGINIPFSVLNARLGWRLSDLHPDDAYQVVEQTKQVLSNHFFCVHLEVL
jgi:hypothetical protein